MTTTQFIILVIGLGLPTLYQRAKFAIKRSLFDKTRLRSKSGLNIHHGHWGLLLSLISTALLISGIHNVYTIALAGLGWGLMLDEIIPMLKMPSVGRDAELEVYGKTQTASLLLVGLTIVIVAILFFALH